MEKQKRQTNNRDTSALVWTYRVCVDINTKEVDKKPTNQKQKGMVCGSFNII